MLSWFFLKPCKEIFVVLVALVIPQVPLHEGRDVDKLQAAFLLCLPYGSVHHILPSWNLLYAVVVSERDLITRPQP